jgi:hypothetical protein
MQGFSFVVFHGPLRIFSGKNAPYNWCQLFSILPLFHGMQWSHIEFSAACYLGKGKDIPVTGHGGP